MFSTFVFIIPECFIFVGILIARDCMNIPSRRSDSAAICLPVLGLEGLTEKTGNQWSNSIVNNIQII